MSQTHEDPYAGEQLPGWEIGGPQPAIVAALGALGAGSRVLDLGCGTGDLALHLAASGHDVTGVDISSMAVNLARSKAAERGVTATFRVGDARHPADVAGGLTSGVGQAYDLVLDSGLLQSLAVAEQASYAMELPQVCAPGGTLVLLAAGITPAALRTLVEEGWASVEITEAPVAGSAGTQPGLLLTARR